MPQADTGTGNSIRDRLQELPRGHQLFICFPSFDALLTGCQHATISKDGLVTLTYTDETTEARDATADFLSADADEITSCQIVAFVQASRSA